LACRGAIDPVCSVFISELQGYVHGEQPDAAFVAKLSIVIEEVDKSVMWLEFLKEEVVMSENEELRNIHQEATELTAMFIAARKKLNNRNK
jgi:four helix bundle protein